MSDDHSNGEGGGGHEADPVDTTEDMEIELNLPRELEWEQYRPRTDIREPPGAIGPRETALDQEERFEPPNGAISKWPRHGLPLPSIVEPRSPVTGATANLGGSGMDRRGLGVTAPIFTEFTQRRRSAGVKTPTRIDLERDWDFPGPGEQLPREGTQFDPDSYADVRSDEKY